jgi:hypothetical protein
VGALLVIAVVAGTAAVLLLTGDDEDPSAEAGEALLDALPASLRRDCDLEEPPEDEPVLAEASCAPDVGADEVEVTAFARASALNDAYDEALEPAAEDPDRDADCATAHYAEHPWTTEDEEDDEVGRVACFYDGDDESWIVWTDDREDLLLVAQRNDDDDAALYQWWVEAVDRFDPNPFPNDAEADLLTHVPEGMRDSCGRAELRERETASVQCTPDAGASSVFYNQYRSAQDAIGQYGQLRRAAGVDLVTGQTDECPFENAVVIDEVRTGRVFCAINDSGSAYLVWTHRPLEIQAEATIAPGASVPEFWAWWANAGPV